ncbi:hypothetical protein L596_010129 [Steinernema carpocapsae]|uniref:Uncharacterized protein n=1 Tax=Steinernema carpocapsae TaxID=34508 RepID=A0A4U5PHG0_STECR|nr:hypothetical protein L596_010129 [Steinernema carpocapsae]
MSDYDSDYNDAAHEKLLKTISQIGSEKPAKQEIKKKVGKISVEQLVNSIKSTKNLNDVKKQLHLDAPKGAKGKKKIKKGARTLDTPLHRHAKERIESSVAYGEIRKDLRVWDSVVSDNRTAEQLVFPLDREPIKIRSGADISEDFVPRTELEKQMSAVLHGSKNNLTNKEVYTEAERELIKAMSLKEAKEKSRQLQKMRALMSFREAKLKRESKIKSKKFHRIKKREQRKKLIKEFEDLITRDPEAAKEKLAQLELDRIEERGSLKHSTKGKWKQQLMKYASRNEGVKNFMDDHMKLGQELRSKHDIESSDESSDDEGVPKKKTTSEILREAAEAAANEDKNLVTVAENPFLRDQLAKVREAKKEAGKRTKTVTEEEFQEVKSAKKSKKALFDVDDWEKPKEVQEAPKEKEKAVEDEISVNPKEFLNIENNALVDINRDVMDTVEEFGDELQQDALAAAFEDDDVIADFEDERDEVHGVEKPQDIDLNLLGWGSWTGPGLEKKAPKKRFILKAKEMKRKDKANVGLIIRENIDSAIEELQPNEIPFPYTTIDDYETMLNQPIGKDWNPVRVTKELTKPGVKTEAGRIIRPLDKGTTLAKRDVREVSDDSDVE